MKSWLLGAALVAVVAVSMTPALDNKSAELADAALKRALVTFALARTLNGVISVAQGTEVAVEPAGVGVIVAAGELLDPINDLIERFSWIMLAASTSLGVQKVLLSISAWWGLTASLAIAALAWLVVRWRPTTLPDWAEPAARRTLVVLLFARFTIPLLVVINHFAVQLFLADEQARAAAALEQTSEEIRRLNDDPEPAQENPGLAQRLSDMFDSGMAMLDMEASVEKLRSTLSSVTERIVELIVLFTLETVLFPLFFLWLFLRVLKIATRE
ncbi:MAG: hypothetical protein AAFN78_12335 [Pseudomonadota bacterium]